MIPSSGGSSFLGCFGTVTENLQRCADRGNQLPARDHPDIRLCTDLTTTIVSHCYPHCPSLLFYNHSDAISASPLSRLMSCILSNLISQYNNDSQGWPEGLPNKALHSYLHWENPYSPPSALTVCHKILIFPHFPLIFVFHSLLPRSPLPSQVTAFVSLSPALTNLTLMN